ncbi:S1C family serine protease [Halalkalibacter alkaliphilus]|uniref:S1C family serine protease n=1 Tax=Halalkalibacter alkaliphilus TaxID=2917993 RepID=A0A9X2CVY9_9BACI|nr:trypsin-like peptidase domain-containing protein [Halalkalibacter alkaliphilus]MCL7749221.1 S1C family serine protease [Halalkalibacter alkaliphilus]
MKKQWIISCITTIMIFGVGFYSFTLIKESVASQLNTAAIAASESTEDTKEKAPAESKEIKDIIHETQKLVVQIEIGDYGIGSGFLYNDQGDIVTNAHVVAGVTNVTVKTADNREFPGKVIGISENTDVAVVRVDGLKGTEPLQISKEKNAEIGDEVLALGSPLGFQNTVTTGIISGVDRDFELPPYQFENVYQISAPIAPGNSGGPLINRKTGEVVGINSASAEQGSIGFSIPLPNVLALIEGWSNSPMTSLPNNVEQNDYFYEEDSFTDEQLARYLVMYFYESLNVKDYVTAYSLLGSSWQRDTTYESFRNGYTNTEAVYIDELSVTTNGDITVTAIISAEEWRNGSYSYQQYKTTYTVGYENDQMKIISGGMQAVN